MLLIGLNRIRTSFFKTKTIPVFNKSGLLRNDRRKGINEFHTFRKANQTLTNGCSCKTSQKLFRSWQLETFCRRLQSSKLPQNAIKKSTSLFSSVFGANVAGRRANRSYEVSRLVDLARPEWKKLAGVCTCPNFYCL